MHGVKKGGGGFSDRARDFLPFSFFGCRQSGCAGKFQSRQSRNKYNTCSFLLNSLPPNPIYLCIHVCVCLYGCAAVWCLIFFAAKQMCLHGMQMKLHCATIKESLQLVKKSGFLRALFKISIWCRQRSRTPSHLMAYWMLSINHSVCTWELSCEMQCVENELWPLEWLSCVLLISF